MFYTQVSNPPMESPLDGATPSPVATVTRRPKPPPSEPVPDGLRSVFAKNLRSARQEAGLSLRALVAKSGVAMSYIVRAESGGANVTLDMVEKLAAALGKSPTDLLTSRRSASPKK